MFASNDGIQLPNIPARKAPRRDPSTFFQGLGAAFRMESLETDAWGRANAVRREVADEAFARAQEEIGADEFNRRVDSLISDQARGTRWEGRSKKRREAQVMREAGLEYATPEAIAKETQRRLQEEYKDAADTFAFMGRGSGVAEFLGRGGAAVSDPTSLALAVVGSPGATVARTFLREVALGAFGEALILPRQYEMAEVLEIEDPNPLMQIALGGAFAGVLFGGTKALTRGGRAAVKAEFGRAIEAAQARIAPPKDAPETVSPMEASRQVEVAEKALNEGRLPQPEELSPQPPAPRPSYLDAPEPQDAGDLFIQPEKPAGKPPTSLKSFIVGRGGILKTPDASDLEALEYRRPGFLRTEARRSSTGGNNGGGVHIDRMRESAYEAGFISRESTVAEFIDLIARDVDPSQPNVYPQGVDASDWAQYEEAMQAFDRYQSDPFRTLYPEGIAAQKDPDTYVSKAIDDFQEASGVEIDPEDRALVQQKLREEGGDVDSALERVYIQAVERDVTPGLTDDPDFDIPFGEADRASGRAAGGEGSVRGETQGGGGPARQGGTAGASEATPAGEQSLVPGVEPITDRQRMEAQMGRPLQGGEDAMIDGLFDMNARQQTDMFDDPLSADVDELNTASEIDLREAIEMDGDFEVSVGAEGNTRTQTASQWLDELDADEEFVQIAELCGVRQ